LIEIENPMNIWVNKNLQFYATMLLKT
jgi:hypothetical protein